MHIKEKFHSNIYILHSSPLAWEESIFHFNLLLSFLPCILSQRVILKDSVERHVLQVSLNFSHVPANMMCVAPLRGISCKSIGLSGTLQGFFTCFSFEARDSRAVVNTNNILFKQSEVELSTRKTWCKWSVAQPPEILEAVAPEEGDRESLRCKAASHCEKKLFSCKDNKWSVVDFLGNGMSLVRKTACVHDCEDRKITFCPTTTWTWHWLLTLLLLLWPRKPHQLIRGPPEADLVMCNGAAGLKLTDFWVGDCRMLYALAGESDSSVTRFMFFSSFL